MTYTSVSVNTWGSDCEVHIFCFALTILQIHNHVQRSKIITLWFCTLLINTPLQKPTYSRSRGSKAMSFPWLIVSIFKLSNSHVYQLVSFMTSASLLQSKRAIMRRIGFQHYQHLLVSFLSNQDLRTNLFQEEGNDVKYGLLMGHVSSFK